MRSIKAQHIIVCHYWYYIFISYLQTRSWGSCAPLGRDRSRWGRRGKAPSSSLCMLQRHIKHKYWPRFSLAVLWMIIRNCISNVAENNPNHQGFQPGVNW